MVLRGTILNCVTVIGHYRGVSRFKSQYKWCHLRMSTKANCGIEVPIAVSHSRRVNVSLRSSVICLDAFGSAARSAHERCRTRACAVTRAYSSCSAQLVLHRRRRVGRAHVLLARRAPLTSLRPRVRYRPCPIRRPRLRSIKSASDQPGAYLHRSAPPPLPPLQLRYRRETGADESSSSREHEGARLQQVRGAPSTS